MVTPDLYSVIDKIHTSLWLVYNTYDPDSLNLVCKATWKKYDDPMITFIGLYNGQFSLSQVSAQVHRDLIYLRNNYAYYKNEHGQEISALVTDQESIMQLLKKYKCRD